MSMLVNKMSYMSCVNGAEMWALEEKKFISVNRFIESHSRPIKTK